MKNLLIYLIPLLFIGCLEEEEENVNNILNTKIKIDVDNFDNFGLQTRTTLDGNSSFIWENGDTIGIYSPQAVTALGGNIPAINQPFVYKPGRFEGELYWKDLNINHTFTAYYPYKKDAVDSEGNLKVGLNYTQKQTDNGNFSHIKNYDLMVSDPIIIKPINSPVKFNKFKHVFSLLEFKIKSSKTIHDILLSNHLSDITSIYSIESKINLNSSFSEDKFTTNKKDGHSILLFNALFENEEKGGIGSNDEIICYGIMEPTTLSGSEILIHKDDNTFTKTFLPEMKYERGKKYTFSLNLDENLSDIDVVITLTKSGTLEEEILRKGILKTKKLRIIGCVDENDLNFIKEKMSFNLEELDLKLSYQSNPLNGKFLEIPNGFFKDSQSLKKIYLPAGAGDVSYISIGNEAFKDCSHLTVVDLDMQLLHATKGVGNSAFENCSQCSFSFPSNRITYSIGYNGFKNCKLYTTSLQIGYWGCPFITVDLSCFNGTNLKKLALSGTSYPKITNNNINDKFDINTLDQIEYSDANFKESEILNNIDFKGELILSGSTTLGGTFGEKLTIKKLIITGHVIFNDNVFSNSKIVTVNVGYRAALETNDNSFSNVDLSNFTLVNNSTLIASDNSFLNYNLKLLKADGCLVKIMDNSFRNNTISTIDLTNNGRLEINNTNIKNDTLRLENSGIRFFELHEVKKLTVIGNLNAYSLTNVKATTLDLTETKNISTYAIYSSSIGTLFLNGDENIGNRFNEKSDIKTIVIKKDIAISHFLDGKIKTENTELVILNSCTRIGDYAFNECTGFTKTLTLPNTITYIGNYAFNEYAGHTSSLTFPNSLKTIGDYAFNNANIAVETLDFPDSLESIGTHAFYGVEYERISIKKNVTQIGIHAFTLSSTGKVLDLYWQNKDAVLNAIHNYDVNNIPDNGIFHSFRVTPPIADYPNMYVFKTIYVPKGTIDYYLSAHYEDIVENNFAGSKPRVIERE
jgi:hypothetical protein